MTQSDKKNQTGQSQTNSNTQTSQTQSSQNPSSASQTTGTASTGQPGTTSRVSNQDVTKTGLPSVSNTSGASSGQDRAKPLSQDKPPQEFTDKPATSSMSGVERGVFVALGTGLIALGLRKPNKLGAGLGVLGTVVIASAIKGFSPYDAVVGIRRTKQGGGIHVRKAVTINVDKDRLYRFWRQYENLPQFMSHLQSVTQRDERVSHWVAKAPANLEVAWDAETVEDVPGERIAWKSIEGATVPNEGRVEFRDAPGGRGTEVHVELQYFPPGGTLGAGIARLFGEEPSQQIQDDLTKLKRILEVGHQPTTQGQPTGREPGTAHAASGKSAEGVYDRQQKADDDQTGLKSVENVAGKKGQA